MGIGRAIGVALAAALVASAAAGVWAEEKGAGPGEKSEREAEQVKTMTLGGRVFDGATGQAAAGASVSWLGETTVTDQSGRFSFSSVPQTRDAMLNFRIVTEAGGIVGCAFIPVPVSLQPVSARLGEKFAVEVVSTAGDSANVDITISEVKGAAVADACAVCHQPNPCLAAAKDGQGWSQVTHLGGLTVTEAEFESTKARVLAEGIRDEDYPNLRFQDAHPQKVNLAANIEAKPGLFKLPDALPLLEGGVSTCDTCHTRHEPTQNGLFLRLDMATQTLLCRQCHT